MIRWFTFTTLLMILTPACAEEHSMRIRCELSMSKTLQSAQPAELVFTLTNEGRDVIHVLNWQTPFEGIKAPMLDVARDGTAIEYSGRMLKRTAPQLEDYFTLKPGERKQAKINLAEAWDVSQPGKYSVEYASELFDVVAGDSALPRSLDDLSPMPISCNAVSFTRVR